MANLKFSAIDDTVEPSAEHEPIVMDNNYFANTEESKKRPPEAQSTANQFDDLVLNGSKLPDFASLDKILSKLPMMDGYTPLTLLRTMLQISSKDE